MVSARHVDVKPGQSHDSVSVFTEGKVPRRRTTGQPRPPFAPAARLAWCHVVGFGEARVSRPIPVYVNGERVEVTPPATMLDAVRTWSTTAAREVEQGRRVITDSRGLPVDGAGPVEAGTIVRLVPARDRERDADPV